ncbi:hypothetical protein G6M89_09035 [Natronolimnobius sp. AArcel1]|uniref:hypothetical protein n=1 Tax=Natronolimnobius sp. AArcel1 TaxID=1679093 RepID=UPI0013ECDC95|nr:hypothetical protein [Natronolimnobius sp. AArcel1]NGM69150.1 hypothetical protein [Natronolimnobius sp. AArcel1]
MTERRRTLGMGLLAGALVATVVIYAGLVPTAARGDEPARALLYLVGGWLPYTLVFYLLGRFFSSPSTLPSMRTADLGLGAVVILLLLSLGLEAWGATPERIPEAHIIQAIGIFVGLALFGWGLGRRSKAITDTLEP